MPSVTRSGQIEDALHNAHVIHACETGGFPIHQVRVAENLIAATIRIDDSTTILKAWDHAGHTLFANVISDSFHDGDNAGMLRPWLGCLSPDGSTIAYSQGFRSTLLDRGGKILTTLPVYTATPSPSGNLWVSASSRGSCESDNYGLFDRAGVPIDLDTTGTGGHAYAVFLSDSELVIQWATFGAIHEVPSGTIKCWLPAEQHFSEEHGPVAMSRTGEFIAIESGYPRATQIRTRAGSVVWESDTIDADVFAFSPDERWLAMFTDVYENEFGLTFLGLALPEEPFRFSIGRSQGPTSWVRGEWIQTGVDSMALLTLRKYEDDLTKFFVVDLKKRSIVDSTTTEGGYLAIPGFPDLFYQIGVAVKDSVFEGHTRRRRTKTSIDLVSIPGLVKP